MGCNRAGDVVIIKHGWAGSVATNEDAYAIASCAPDRAALFRAINSRLEEKVTPR